MTVQSRASCEFSRSQTPSLPRMRTLSLEDNILSETLHAFIPTQPLIVVAT